MDFKTIKDIKHYIYDSEEEFYLNNAKSIKIKPWRESEELDWVFTDNNCVVQVLRKTTFKSSNNRNVPYIRTICGSFTISGKKLMLGEISDNIYSFSKKKQNEHYYTTSNKKSTSKREMLFARYVASGDDIVDSYLKAFPTENKNYAEIQSKRLLTSQRMQKMIKEEVQSALNEVGVSPEYLIERFKDIADISERDSDKLRSLEMLAKISGLFDTNNSKEQLTVWSGFSPEQLESIKGGSNARVEAHIERTPHKVESKSS